MHPQYQEHIKVLSCILCTWVFEYWNWFWMIDDVVRKHKVLRKRFEERLECHCRVMASVCWSFFCRLLIYGQYCSHMENAQKTLDELIATREDVKCKVEVGSYYNQTPQLINDMVTQSVEVLEICKISLIYILMVFWFFMYAVSSILCIYYVCVCVCVRSPKGLFGTHVQFLIIAII